MVINLMINYTGKEINSTSKISKKIGEQILDKVQIPISQN